MERRRLLQIVGVFAAGLVVGVLIGGYVVPGEQIPLFGGAVVRRYVGPPAATVTTTASPAFTIPSKPFPLWTCDIVVSPVRQVFDKAHPAPVSYTVKVSAVGNAPKLYLYLRGQAGLYMQGNVIQDHAPATFSQSNGIPPFTSTLTWDSTKLLLVPNNSYSSIMVDAYTEPVDPTSIYGPPASAGFACESNKVTLDVTFIG